MAVEAATHISELVASNPDGATVPVSELDNHARLIKQVLLNSFANISGAVTATHIELNKLAGCTSSTAELNLLTGKSLASNDDVIDNFPTGTKMAFFQAAAPTGWTQDTTHNDKALRVVSGSGGGSGGTHGLSSPPSTAHTHTGPSHTHSYNTVIAHIHTFTTNTDGSHAHVIDNGVNLNSGINNGGVQGTQSKVANYNTTQTGGAHAHSGTTNSTGSGSGTTGASGTGSTSSNGPTAFSPTYIDVTVCEKD